MSATELTMVISLIVLISMSLTEDVFPGKAWVAMVGASSFITFVATLIFALVQHLSSLP